MQASSYRSRDCLGPSAYGGAFLRVSKVGRVLGWLLRLDDDKVFVADELIVRK